MYNDLKPDNICVGEYKTINKLHKLKLIDFGLSTPYLYNDPITNELKHIKMEHKEFQGNLAFSSKNAFNEITLSRRDDLISLVYMLLYLSSGRMAFIKHHLPLIDQVS